MATAMVQEQVMECGDERHHVWNEEGDSAGADDHICLRKDQIRQLKLLLRTMCLISRDMPVPEALLSTLAKLRQAWASADQEKNRGLLSDLEEAVEHVKLGSALELRSLEVSRIETKYRNRVQELEGKMCSMDLHPASGIELNTLKLLDLQRKVRGDLAGELHLKQTCNRPDSQLLDWGLMRLRYHIVSFLGGKDGGIYYGATDEQMRKKRDAERQKRVEQEEQARYETKKRKFFMELQNCNREFILQAQTSLNARKQRNDSVQNWHGKQRLKLTRAEKTRLNLLRTDDQDAYMKLVQESKNERLMTLLSKTDDLLQRLGVLVQLQKDAEPEDGFKRHKDKHREAGKDGTDPTKNKGNPNASNANENALEEPSTRDLLEGQRRYNSAVHQIEEQVTEQPAMLEGGELRPYQLEGLQWMLSLYNNNLNGILADEMGLGKTIQTIGLFAYLMENKNLQGPHIIIAPKAVVPNWASEFAAWAPSVTCVVYDGRGDHRKIIQGLHSGEGSFNVLVTHYDLVMRDKSFLKKIKWHYMVVDEGHRLKNHECQLARIIHTNYHIRRRLLLTGTPIQNTLQELWSLLNFILPAIFNSSYNFEEWFNAPFADRSDVSLTEEEQFLIIRRLHQVLRPFLLRRKKSEVEKYLPSKTQVILKCDLSAWQKIYYQQIIESGRVSLQSGAKNLMNTAMQLRKCCNHPYLFFDHEHEAAEDEVVRASGKFELLDRLLPKLQKAGHRVLLFSQMTKLMDILERYLASRGFKHLRLDGTTKTEDRGRLLKLFNAEDSPYFMFLLSTRAGGLGLNLQTADTVILFDSDWNPQMDQQAEDRAHRIGQKKEVHVFVLVSVGSIEEEILERAKGKMGIDAKVIQAGLFNTTSTAQERRDMLEEIMRRGTSALSTDVPSEREINRLTAATDEEFELYEAMDEKRRNNENYRSRLMEEHEVPEWVFLQKQETAPKYEFTAMEGKRKRKEVQYSDTLSDSQWLKAVEGGRDVTEITATRRTRSRADSVTPSRRTATPTPAKVVLRVRRTRSGDSGTGKSSNASAESESEAPTSSVEDRPESSVSQSERKRLRRKRKCPDSDEEEEEEEEAQAADSEEDVSYEKNSNRNRRRSRHS